MSSARHDGARGILALGDTMRNLGMAAIAAALMAGTAPVVQAQNTHTPVRPAPAVVHRRELRDRLEDRRDRREDVRDRRENVRDRRENVRDRREDVRDRREDIRDRREDVRDRRENVRDRRENVRDRIEDRRDRRTP
jgi:hypothetical protein